MVVMVVAHTIMIEPVPRAANVHVNGGFECGTSNEFKATYRRGQVVPIKWGRNNHHGGFSQLSVLPFAQASGSKVNDAEVRKAFNNPANIFHTSCYLSSATCKAQGNNKFGLGGDGTDFQKTLCSTTFTVPTWLADGEYVMKWTVFGNGDSHGVRNMAHVAYSNCHNFKVSGGTGPVAKPAGNKHIEFKLQDDAIRLMNERTGSKVPQGQCMFSGGANNPSTCVPDNNKKSPKCTGRVSDLARCGGGTADSRKECLLSNNEGQTDGGDLYNFMIGLPDYHPDYDGHFLLLSEATGRPNSRPVALAGAKPAGPAPAPAPAPTPKSSSSGGSSHQIVWSKNGGATSRHLGTSGTTDGSSVVTVTAATKWVFTSCGNIKLSGTNKCLDVTKGVDENGTDLQIWECGCTNPNQLWEKLSWGGYKWKNHDKCVDVSGGNEAVGTKVQIWTCSTNWANQKFQEKSKRKRFVKNH